MCRGRSEGKSGRKKPRVRDRGVLPAPDSELATELVMQR